jgi:hypothetical protein
MLGWGLMHWNTGGVKPPSTRYGPMTPGHSIAAGVLFLCFGGVLLWTCLRSDKKS